MLHLFGNPPRHAIDSYSEIIPIDYNWKDSLTSIVSFISSPNTFWKGYYESVMKIITNTVDSYF